MTVRLALRLAFASLAVVVRASLPAAAAAGEVSETEFHYQGQLQQHGRPVTGLCDFRFELHEAPSGPDLEVAVVNAAGVSVENGLFAVMLDFGAEVFSEAPIWMEIDVQCPVPGEFPTSFTLVPRVRLLPAPAAMRTRGLTVDANNNVGIRTSNPLADLHVLGGDALGMLTVTPGESDSSAQLLLTENVSASLGGIVRYDGTSNQLQLLGLARDENQQPIEHGPHLVVGRDNGRVGIGTTTPERLLHVQDGDAGMGSNASAKIVAEGAGGAFVNVLSSDAFQNGILFGTPSTGSAGGGVLFNNSSTPAGLQFRAGGNSTKMVIQSDGDVGIGTTSPIGRLHVAAPAGDDSVVLPNDSIGPEETSSEPGLAFSESFNAIISSGDPPRLVTARTIDPPDAGLVLAIATVECGGDLTPFAAPTFDVAVRLSTESSGGTRASATAPGAGATSMVTVQRPIPVDGSGPLTVEVYVTTNGLQIVKLSQLSLLYFPTAYGAVDVRD